MKILVALDATPRSDEIVAGIAAQSWPKDTSFSLLHVLEPFPFRKAVRPLDEARDAAEALLKELASRLNARGWPTEERVLLGRPWRQITKLAAFCEMDLIVVGSHRAGAIGQLLGSTARSVLRHAPCSVEVVRGKGYSTPRAGSTSMNVLVATDGSECSTIALRSVSRRTWPRNTRFRVVSIPHPSMPLSSFPEKELKNIISIRHAKRYAQSGAELLRSVGLQAESNILLPRHGDGYEIVEEAQRWPAHLIVMGSHGRRGYTRLRLGSVSEYVVQHAPCSVEVIRQTLSEAEAQRAQSPVMNVTVLKNVADNYRNATRK